MIKRIILFLILPTLLFGQINNWRNKTINQLSGIVSGTTDIGRKSYWETKAYNQIRDIISRLDTVRYATDFTNIDNAVSSLVSGGPLVVPSGTFNINGSSLTIPANVEFIMEKGAILNGTVAKTVTINGNFRAGIYQVFGSNVTVTFDTGSVDIVYPEWWGLSSDSTDQDAFNAMWTALPTGHKGIIRLVGDYYFSDTWTIEEANDDSIPKSSVYINGYGSSIWSEADTTIKVKLGWYTQGEAIHTIEGLRIFGNGNEGGTDDQDAGTNYGIWVQDVSNLKIVNCSIRNCGNGIVLDHYGPGTVYTPYCDAVHITDCVLMCNDQGIVFVSTDTSAHTVGITADFDHSVITGNRIQITNGDSDTTDACIKISDSTRVSRSIFANNMTWTTGRTNAYYINGAIGGTSIDIWHEATSGSGTSATIYVGDSYEEPVSYGQQVRIRQASGTPVALKNYSQKRFPYEDWSISNLNLGTAWTDWNGNLTFPQLDILGLTTTGGLFNPRCLYTFDYTSNMDTVYSDVSGNSVEFIVHGATKSLISSTGVKTLSFDGSDDYATTENVKVNGDIMMVCAIIPDNANTHASENRVFKWYRSPTTYVLLNYADGSNQSVFSLAYPSGSSTIDYSYSFAASTPLVYGLIIDATDNQIEMWINGNLVETVSYTGTLPDSNGTFTFGSEFGAGSLFTPFDIAFFAVYPNINRRVLQNISENCLNAMGTESLDFTVYDDFTAHTSITAGDSSRVNSSGAWIRKQFWSVTGDSLGIVSYNTVSSKLDTAWAVTK